MAIRTTTLDESAKVEPWCNHRDEPQAGPPCRKAGIAVGAPGPDGRAPYVCTNGHHFLWPHPAATSPTGR
ncbi:MAG TPA: hypothetical protein VHO06_23460 [Polyangia bacterium]|nr:hypothetical protein [Polyangia bacterium]